MDRTDLSTLSKAAAGPAVFGKGRRDAARRPAGAVQPDGGLYADRATGQGERDLRSPGADHGRPAGHGATQAAAQRDTKMRQTKPQTPENTNSSAVVPGSAHNAPQLFRRRRTSRVRCVLHQRRDVALMLRQ